MAEAGAGAPTRSIGRAAQEALTATLLSAKDARGLTFTAIGQAVENAIALEIVADLAHRTLQLDPRAAPLPQPLIEKHFHRKHGEGAYYGQP